MKQHRGFTLIELSIVLVIISLIIGGVIGGRALIVSSRLQGVTANINTITTAINNFTLQYDALPGDMRDATDYWPSAISPDGNGDGFIFSNGSTTNMLTSERLGFWEHLRLAEMLEGTGNIPYASSLAEGQFRVMCKGGCDASGGFYTRHGSYIVLDNIGGDNHLTHGSALLNARHARTIDKKMDDGIANKGKILTTQGLTTPTTECVSKPFWSPSTTVEYNLNEDSISCILNFYILPPDNY